MGKKDFTEYKRKYQAFRHHAWAGLGFLSVLLAISVIAPWLLVFLSPILVVLIAYVVISLLFTYKYYKGVSAALGTIQGSEEIAKEKIHANVEKKHLKLEKKKAKAEEKSKKKLHKK
jgi:MFS superfamily sulfate permease-like transporter